MRTVARGPWPVAREKRPDEVMLKPQASSPKPGWAGGGR